LVVYIDACEFCGAVSMASGRDVVAASPIRCCVSSRFYCPWFGRECFCCFICPVDGFVFVWVSYLAYPNFFGIKDLVVVVVEFVLLQFVMCQCG